MVRLRDVLDGHPVVVSLADVRQPHRLAMDEAGGVGGQVRANREPELLVGGVGDDPSVRGCGYACRSCGQVDPDDPASCNASDRIRDKSSSSMSSNM